MSPDAMSAAGPSRRKRSPSGGSRSLGTAASVGPSLFEYLLRLGDTDVVLAQRLGEWVGHGPVLEEDIALTNVGLDLLGQGRMWLTYAGEVEARFRDQGRSEDELAFLRDGGAYRNLLLAEMPNGDFAVTMARQFYFDQFHLLLLRALTRSSGSARRGNRRQGRQGSRLPRRAQHGLGRSAWATAPTSRTRGCSGRSTTCGRTRARCSPPMRPSSRWPKPASASIRARCASPGWPPSAP